MKFTIKASSEVVSRGSTQSKKVYTKFLTGIAFVLLAMQFGTAQAATLGYCAEASPETFDAPQGAAQSTADATMPIFDTLVGIKPGTTELFGALAERYETSADGLVYTMHLRRGVKFHSNRSFRPTRDFNADDVVFSWERQRDEKHSFNKVGSGVYGHFYGQGLDKLVARLVKVDDYTVRFVLARPDVSFLALMTTPTLGAIFSAEYAQSLLAAKTPEKLATEPIGTGAFRLLTYQRDALIRYEAFKEHWAFRANMPELAPQVDQLVFIITPDPAVRYAKLLAGECHIVRFPNPADITLARTNRTVKVVEIPSMDYAFWGFNTEKKPFDDQRVRMALSLAIDKDAIMKTIFRGEIGVPAGGVVPPGLLGHDASIKPYPHDVARAKKLLAEAGLPNGFKTEIWAMPVVRAYMPNARRTAELMQANLAEIGVTAEIKSVEWAEYLRRSIAGEHQTVILGWNYAVPDPGQILTLGWTCAAAKNGLNRSRWCNLKFDEAVAAAGVVSDPAERTRRYVAAQKIFYDDAAALLIAYAAKIAIISPKVEGYKIAPVGPQFFVGMKVAN